MTAWEPVAGQLITRWGAEVNPENAWQEYPRPQLRRSAWHNLNGLWDYAIAPVEMEMVLEYTGQILVPFPLESALSGVKRALQPDERLWYRRRFSLPDDWTGTAHPAAHWGVRLANQRLAQWQLAGNAPGRLPAIPV